MSSCENPQSTNWVWKYNRNKYVTDLEPWRTRVDLWPPRYRHMGVNYGFQFNPGAHEHRPLQEVGAPYCQDLAHDRATGFGNAALGNPPGPAPPRLKVYSCEENQAYMEQYLVNQINDISGGMSLLDRALRPAYHIGDGMGMGDTPILPKTYLQKTLDQHVDQFCNFPYFALPKQAPAPMAHKMERQCDNVNDGVRRPLEVWTRENNRRRLQDTDTACHSYHYTCPVYTRTRPSIQPGTRPTSSADISSAVVRHHKAEGDRRRPYPLANF